MTRLVLIVATSLLVMLWYMPSADACGVKLPLKAPRVERKWNVQASANPSRILLVGSPPRKLARSLSQAGHTVDVAEEPSSAPRKDYAVVVADADRADAARTQFPNSRVIVRSSSMSSNIDQVENAVSQKKGPRRAVAAASKRPTRKPASRPIRTSEPVAVTVSRPPQSEVAPRPAESTNTDNEVAATDKSPGADSGSEPTDKTPPRGKPRAGAAPGGTAGESSPVRKATLTKVFFFGANSSTLSQSNRIRSRMEANARWLQENPDVKITIEGHANALGPDDYNRILGERRAETVRALLIELGVDGSRIEVISYGSERPAYSPPSDGRNRRVVIVVN